MAQEERSEERMQALERAVAHLEAAQQDMSETIARQWTEIDKLTRTLELLYGRLQDLEPAHESHRPPHY